MRVAAILAIICLSLAFSYQVAKAGGWVQQRTVTGDVSVGCWIEGDSSCGTPTATATGTPTATPTSSATPTATPTHAGPSVGGIAEQPDLSRLPVQSSTATREQARALEVGIAAVAAVMIAAGGWIAIRRRKRD
jgi:hypothetical protein